MATISRTIASVFEWIITRGDNKLKNDADEVVQNSVHQKSDIKSDMFIIGAGFGRTGTSSLQLALSELGIRCYHMRETWKTENAKDMDHFIELGKIKYELKEKYNVKSFDNWHKVNISKTRKNVDWNKTIFKKSETNEYNACLDYPSILFYLDLMEYYSPNYKVILTVRDSPNKWYDSTKITIFA
eukprot:491446_1